jgi:hypothetical protein
MKKQISFTGKHIFWKQKDRNSKVWSEGYVYKQEGDMIPHWYGREYRV